MTLNIGWIGCGNHASEMLLPQLVRHDIRFSAIADLDPQRLALIGNRYGVATRTTDALALLDTPGLHAIGMAVGPKQHAEFAAAAMRKGLAVFIEKPPAATAAEADVLAQIADSTKQVCVVGFMKRYSTANRIAGNILRTPAFGPSASLLGEYMTAPG